MSIILVTHNSGDYLRDCLAHIEKNTSCPYELIIVDNASTDGTGGWLQAYEQAPHSSSLQRLKILRNPVNKFFTKAVNQGIKKSTGEYLAIVNADVIVTENCLCRLLDRFRHLPDAAALGPMLGGSHEKSHYYTQGYEERYGTLLVQYPPDLELQEFAAENYRKYQGAYAEAKVLCFACVMLRRAAVERIGGLDEKFSLSGDDWEWSLRARAAGFGVYVAEDCFALHYRKGSIKTIPSERRTKLGLKDREHWVKVLYKYHNPATLPNKPLSFDQIINKQTPFLDVSHAHPKIKKRLAWNDLFVNKYPFHYRARRGKFPEG